MNLSLSEIIKLLVEVAVPIGAAGWAYCHYLRQRENELVRSRYLEQGLDGLIANAQNALSIYQHNWSLSLSLLKQFKDLGSSMSRKDLDKFLAIDFFHMDITPVHRVRVLFGDDVIWDIVQYLFAFVRNANFDFEHDLADMIRNVVDSKVSLTVSKEEAIEKYMEKIETIRLDSHIFFDFLSLLHDSTSLFERNRFTFKTVSSFKDNPEVKNIVARMKAICSEIDQKK